MLKIALQKSDRISFGFLDLLTKCGFKIDKNQSRLYCKFEELPIEIYFVRGSDIPSLLQNQFDVAVIGKDSFLEDDLSKIAKIEKELGFAKCRLSFAGRSFDIKSHKDLNGKIIATSYLKILQNFLVEKNINARIVEMKGSVESAIEIGMSDVVFDIVQTGSTLLQHGLREYFKILDLEAVLITKNNFDSEILNKLLFRIDAVLNASNAKYMMFNLEKSKIKNIIEFLPAGKSPTILELAEKDFCAIHTLCDENKIWNLAENLKKSGARDIIVLDVNLKFQS